MHSDEIEAVLRELMSDLAEALRNQKASKVALDTDDAYKKAMRRLKKAGINI